MTTEVDTLHDLIQLQNCFFLNWYLFYVLFNYYCNYFVILYIYKQMQDVRMFWEIWHEPRYRLTMCRGRNVRLKWSHTADQVFHYNKLSNCLTTRNQALRQVTASYIKRKLCLIPKDFWGFNTLLVSNSIFLKIFIQSLWGKCVPNYQEKAISTCMYEKSLLI